MFRAIVNMSGETKREVVISHFSCEDRKTDFALLSFTRRGAAASAASAPKKGAAGSARAQKISQRPKKQPDRGRPPRSVSRSAHLGALIEEMPSLAGCDRPEVAPDPAWAAIRPDLHGYTRLTSAEEANTVLKEYIRKRGVERLRPLVEFGKLSVAPSTKPGFERQEKQAARKKNQPKQRGKKSDDEARLDAARARLERAVDIWENFSEDLVRDDFLVPHML